MSPRINLQFKRESLRQSTGILWLVAPGTYIENINFIGTTAAKSKSAACVLLPPGAARSQAWDNAAPPARTTCATAPPAPSPPEISLAASSSCTAQSQSSSLESSVSFLRHSNLTDCGKQRA